MRTILPILALLALTVPAHTFDLSNSAPDKPFDNSVYTPPTDPPRQGGDTIAEAIPITIPGTYTGTTVGFTNNYDEVCPFSGSTAPDVVYQVTPTSTISVDIDLCYSSYDTKLYVYDHNLNLIACNDDFHSGAPCFTFSSKLENVPLQSDATYYIIIDGYGSAAGEYQLDITTFDPCVVTCPSYPGVQHENEPPLIDGYEDAHNGGCNSPQFGNPFQRITTGTDFCGVSGWYLGPSGTETRDTDWFLVRLEHSWLEICWADAEYPTYLFQLAPMDCGSVEVLQSVTIGPCSDSNYPFYLQGQPGEDVWLWVGPTTFSGPVNEYTYVLSIGPCGLPTERRSWTDVKSLFN